MSLVWERLTLSQRLTAAAIDIMEHPDFALLSGIVMMGRALEIDTLADIVLDNIKDLPEPRPVTFTAGTDGLDCFYGREFMLRQNRKQVRWVLLHENFHKALRHCTDYVPIVDKHPRESNMAQDFVINAMIDELDPGQAFAQQPQDIEICLHKKYYGWDWLAVLRDILKNGVPPPPKGGGGGKGASGSFDVHIQNANAKGATAGTQEAQEALKKIAQQVQDALYQGKMAVAKRAGKGGGSQTLDNATRERTTDWRTPLREFVEQITAGDENSRFCPPNKRLLASGFLMPSHFSESTGEIHVYCDTSGSMGGVYPIIFGEIARIAQHAKPELLRLIWWDGEVQDEQVFTQADYADIARALKPKGGGGTSPNCVVQYVQEKKYKPKAGIWLTDGYLDGSDAVLPWPVLWGVLDNEHFMPPQGKKLNLNSNDMTGE